MLRAVEVQLNLLSSNMKVRISCILFCAAIVTTLGVQPESANAAAFSHRLSPQSPSSSNDRIATSRQLNITKEINGTHTSGGSNSTLTSVSLICRSDIGHDLSIASCWNAWCSIPSDSQEHVYGARNEGVYEVPLPQRFLSGESYSNSNWSWHQLVQIH